MAPPKHAVIDLGTNTFHLLIAQPGLDTPIREVYRERRFIQLAEQGIQTIGEAPFDRALIA
ncbi:MAG: exopolyphosphatase, partial [Phaeodactylibacter sp.]|nr:exopolyphosphatase [Phaeodactylibacter sp.]